MGTCAFLLDILNEGLYDLRLMFVENTMDFNPGLGWCLLVSFSIVYVFISSSLCVYFGPTAI